MLLVVNTQCACVEVCHVSKYPKWRTCLDEILWFKMEEPRECHCCKEKKYTKRILVTGGAGFMWVLVYLLVVFDVSIVSYVKWHTICKF